VLATHPVCPSVQDCVLDPVDRTEHSPAVEQLCVQCVQPPAMEKYGQVFSAD
jgi:hypothetical protein